MKKLQSALSALTLSVAVLFSAVGCVDSNNRYTDYYDNNNSYPYQGPQHIVIRSRSDGSSTEYITLDGPISEPQRPQDLSRFDNNVKFKSVNNRQAITKSAGYSNVNKGEDGMYFVQQDQNFIRPNNSAAKQTTYWWSMGGCGYNWGYYSYNNYCSYGWNHYYSPYYSNWYGYNNWSWNPTYYWNNSFYYYTPGWSNWYSWGGYNYYYYNMRFW